MGEFFAALLAVPADPEDGLVWGEVQADPIREDQRYGGVRVTFSASLAGAVIPAKVDVGFGDVIPPAPVEMSWQDLLGFPEARLLTYPPETVISEKLHAAEELGLDNSRMKDFYDLDWLCRNLEFEHSTLVLAVRGTFSRRGTVLPDALPVALTQEFANDAGKLVQWRAFLPKNRLEAEPLPGVIARLKEFLEPVLFPAPARSTILWRPGTDWQPIKP